MARVLIENTNFIFNTNFSGDPATDRFGSNQHHGNVIIPTEEQARELMEMGCNVKQTTPRDEQDEPEYFVDIKAGYWNRAGERLKHPSKVYLVSGNNLPKLLDEDELIMIDQMEVEKVDVILNTNEHKPGKRTLWIQTMYVTQGFDNDPFAAKYFRDEPEMDEDIPF